MGNAAHRDGRDTRGERSSNDDRIRQPPAPWRPQLRGGGDAQPGAGQHGAGAPERPVSAQTRIVTDARRFRDTEVIALEDGAVGVLSTPYEPDEAGSIIGAN